MVLNFWLYFLYFRHISIVDIKNKEIILHDCSKNSFFKIINVKNNLDWQTHDFKY